MNYKIIVCESEHEHSNRRTMSQAQYNRKTDESCKLFYDRPTAARYEQAKLYQESGDISTTATHTNANSHSHTHTPLPL